MRFILDASALLAVYKAEPGSEMVAACMDVALILTVNFAEAVTVLDRDAAPGAVRLALAGSRVPVIAPDEALAWDAGLMQRATKPFGLSLADRLCLAFARRYDMTALTADRAWALAAGVVGARAELIR